MTAKQTKRLTRIVTATLLTVCICLLPLRGIAKTALLLLPYLISGADVVVGAWRKIIGGNFFSEKFLMSIATIGAFVIGEPVEAVAVMVLYQTGELFESVAVGRSRKNIEKLMDIRPDTARVVRNGGEAIVSPETVLAGETIRVLPGERIPLDGIISDGRTSLDTSALTGESMPRDVNEGDLAVSGAINLTGVITITTTGTFEQSTVSKILKAAKTAAEKKSKHENFITRFARVYTPCVVIAALLLAVVPSVITGDVVTWIRRALIMLTVSCPCALVISIPLTFFAGIGCASKSGILIKGSAYLEALSHLNTVVFDKTGTLTRGSFEVESINPVGISAEQLLDVAALAECNSTHPLARSILHAHGGSIDTGRVTSVTEHSGLGLEAVIDNKTVLVGNRALMESAGISIGNCESGATVIHIAFPDRYLGHIILTDAIKPDSADTVSQLKQLGVEHTAMLTGDSRAVAADVAEQLGLDSVSAELMPDDKVRAIEDLLADGKTLAFIGDGINDAPVLARADIGIAMGAMGSDAAIEAADAVLMDDKPSALVKAIVISRKTMRIVRENIVFSLTVKAAMLILSAFGAANMWMAIFADVGVMMLAVLNSLRAMR